MELGLSWEFVSGGTQGQELCAPGTGNFYVLDPLFPRLARRAESHGCAWMERVATLLFLGALSIACESGAVHSLS